VANSPPGKVEAGVADVGVAPAVNNDVVTLIVAEFYGTGSQPSTVTGSPT